MVRKLFALIFVTFLAVSVLAQFDISLEDVADQFGVDLSALDLPAFWMKAEEALRAESFEDLAWLLPKANAALAYLNNVPEAKPYADWLRQRLDYFEMADEAETQVVGRQPESRPPAPTPEVKKRVSQTARNGERWKNKMSKRSAPASAGALVPRLKDIFKSEGVPQQLVWLAEVESTMNPSARSPVGAVGLFQMMPATAKRFGLQVSPKDERLIADKNARAAAQYLNILHRQFKSWPLALAAYNAGEGRVGGLLKKSKGRTFDDIADSLPAETQMYVPKVAAVVEKREGTKLERL